MVWRWPSFAMRLPTYRWISALPGMLQPIRRRHLGSSAAIAAPPPHAVVQLLQELVPGRVESSASLLVREGQILHVLVTEYTFLADEYVWPRVKEDRSRRRCQPRT